jgi:hypothetical protein
MPADPRRKPVPLIHIFRAAIFFMVLFAMARPAYSVRADVGLSNPTVEYKFRESLHFRANVKTNQPIREVLVLFGAQGDPHIVSGAADLSPDGEINLDYDLSNNQLRPFSTIQYRYRVIFQDGTVSTSPYFEFKYQDNRFQWQVLEDQLFRVHWYEGDAALAQRILDVAQEGLPKAQSLVNIPSPVGKIDIFVYANAKELQPVLDPGEVQDVAGHAIPDLNVMLVALPTGPEQPTLIEQRIPHELMHVLIYQFVGPTYANLPAWLNEGLSSDTELSPNPDYEILLEDAFQQGNLLSMSSLCATFPRDASGALLAYAQSASFTRYLHNSFGTSGLTDLLISYANGMDCEHGAESALGSGLPQIERQWRQAVFGEDTNLLALQNLIPWFTISLVIMIGPLSMILIRLRRQPLDAMVH